MNILIFSPVKIYPTDAGSRIRIYNITDYLIKQGNKIHYVYYSDHGIDKIHCDHMESVCETFSIVTKSKKVKKRTGNYKLDEWYEDNIDIKINEIIRELDIEVVLTNYIFHSKFLEFLPKEIYKVIDTHDKFTDRYKLFPYEINYNWHSYSKEDEAKALNRADMVIAITDEENRYFSSICDKKIVTLGHLEHKRYLNKKYINIKKIGFIGGVNDINKVAINEFLNLFYKISPLREHIEIIIAGQICKYIDMEHKNIKLLGIVDNLEDFYGAVDIVINPLMLGTGQKIKSVEALSFGVPIISTKVGFEGIKSDNKFHQLNSIKDIIETIEILRSDNSKLDLLAKASCQVFDNYSKEIYKNLNFVFKNRKQNKKVLLKKPIIKSIIENILTQEQVAKLSIDKFIKSKDKEGIKNHYCIVTPVYNAQKYLDAYFDSIVSSSLDFKKYIYIIIVDDGSTDKTPDIINRWKLKYNDNISYIKKENGGQSSARNLGLKYLKAPWVTFIDADDVISNNYFEDVDKFLNKNGDISLVSCNQIFYYEKNSEIKKHYLSHRFKNDITVVNPTNMQGFIQTTASSVFIKSKLIQKHDLYFDEKIKPTFEDGYVINSLLLNEPDANMAFLKSPIYYYRKRENKSSTLDNAWINPCRYLDALEFGILGLLIKAKNRYTQVPLYLQRYALYLIHFYYKRIVNDKDDLKFLNEKQILQFKNILTEIFKYIESTTIEVCGLGGLWHKYRIGFYKLYKNDIIFKQVCYIDGYDYGKKELKVHYYFHCSDKGIFKVNDKEISPSRYEVVEHKFFDDIFVYEKILYLPLFGKWEYLNIQLCGVETQISLNKKRYLTGVQLFQLIQ